MTVSEFFNSIEIYANDRAAETDDWGVSVNNIMATEQRIPESRPADVP